MASIGKKQTDSLTPAMRQYAEQKAQCGDAILLFRMGDFYEMFYDDARTASQKLGLTLTSRGKSKDAIPLAGIPFHALDSYLAKLIAAGCKVAISEQMEDPRQAKGVVKRAIVRIVTPGTLTDDSLLESKSSNYLAAIGAESGGRRPIAWLELSTGAFWCASPPESAVLDELVRIDPAEVLVPEAVVDAGPDPVVQRFSSNDTASVTRRSGHWFDRHRGRTVLCDHLGVATLEGFGISDDESGIGPAAAIVEYLRETQHAPLDHIASIALRRVDDCLVIDRTTLQSLEIERTMRSGERSGSLLSAIDRTRTAMGGRLLRDWICYPLRDLGGIEVRQDSIAELRGDRRRLKESRETLADVSDIERITVRLSLGRGSPRDLLSLGSSLARLPKLTEILGEFHAAKWIELRGKLVGFDDIARLIESSIRHEAPAHLREGGVIADGFHPELDRLRAVATGGRSWLAEFQASEIERTGIPSLKVGFNRVFGYYIEITNVHRDRAPANYVRKQTLKNAERYITDELKQYETEVLTARDRAIDLEADLFEQVRKDVVIHAERLQTAGRALAQVDVLAGLASLAEERRYCRPEIVEENVLEIRDGRHPVLEQILGQEFVPNDVTLDQRQARFAVITGPNMAGKSTYIRQSALLTLLAHTGSMIPASAARIGLTDRIFARIGASDEITRGQSTFMVEMTETANILHNSTDRSLVILDEVGRGTSTYDGLSLAWAISEHIASRINARTLFATHYHELTELANLLEGVVNWNVAVREYKSANGRDAEIVFLHQIVDGGADKSYGVHVARLAGIPNRVVERSKVILEELENSFARETKTPQLRVEKAEPEGQFLLFGQMDKDPVLEEIRGIDVDSMTPLDALKTLAELRDRLRDGRK
jgi:DNA mismatch repair protein MutS